jgi:hypothetical protein
MPLHDEPDEQTDFNAFRPEGLFILDTEKCIAGWA